MNCPAHVQLFKQGTRSYRELPLRIAEFGCCHRNEAHGALHGLLRVRQFTQDDAHIFCREDQIQSGDIEACRRFAEYFEAEAARYEAEAKKRFSEDPLCQFVQQFRNYCLHVANPMVGSQFQFGIRGPDMATLTLVKQPLLSWSGWNPPARKFLLTCPDNIDLRPIISQYFEMADAFRQWIWELFESGNKADFKNVQALQAALRKAIEEDMKST